MTHKAGSKSELKGQWLIPQHTITRNYHRGIDPLLDGENIGKHLSSNSMIELSDRIEELHPIPKPGLRPVNVQSSKKIRPKNKSQFVNAH